ncbi:MAG: (4Fe-4S)-binding protein [Candidatus Cloacimonadota bacterium]|nr:MAG: (4Fe-4S)-binding protein [Candidatus Cloacimonadota bacterium]
MKQIVVISGKGGTGKTVITASFAALANNKVLCDCDVDAADLHLLLHPEINETHQFVGGKKAVIDSELCSGCGECIKVCRFDAISSDFTIDPISCEGCSVCSFVCPVETISMKENISGEWYISETRYGPMVHAKLGIAEENSGKLVSVTRGAAKRIAENKKMDYIIIDGRPGIGCPVIASLSGADIALLVTEPTLSGMHDLERIHSVAKHFGIKTACVINKHDINYENSTRIEDWCKKEGITVIGKIPFEQAVTESVVKGVPVVEYSESPAAEEIKKIWNLIR